MNASSPQFSVIVPVMNEAGNILPLAQAVDTVMALPEVANGDYELIFIDDASRDTTVAEILQAKARNPKVRLLRYPENRGQSRAMRIGIEAARARWIVTLDGDMQNPPSEIARLVAALPDRNTDMLVGGIRQKRQDTASKRYASRAANKIRQWALKDDCPDTGCALRLFPRDAYLQLPFFNHMHRYFPVLFKMIGLPMAFVPVSHSARGAGVSKYTNWQRALVGIVDLVGVRWLQARTRPTKSWEEQ